MGRLTRDPEIKYTQSGNSMAIARYTLAVDRRFKRDGDPTADFINCVAFGKGAEFTEKYFRQGLKVVVTGRIQTGSYTNKDVSYSASRTLTDTSLLVIPCSFRSFLIACDNSLFVMVLFSFRAMSHRCR